MVRAGRHGERENLALDRDLAVIGWEEVPDLSKIRARNEVVRLMEQAYPDAKPNTITNWASQVWTFAAGIQPGDHVVLPLKTRAAVAIGRVEGPYTYRTDLAEDVRHVRPVKWLVSDLPRGSIDQDLLYSLGAFLTVCQIQRNNAEERLLALAKKGFRSESVPSPSGPGEANEDSAPRDLVDLARDQIRTYVGRRYRKAELERLVDAILTAEGYRTQRTLGGADGGADILAGSGPLGFDAPRIVVQVKSGGTPTDVKPLRELQGVVNQFGADQGLLVSWSGFTPPAEREARKLFFKIRLWDSNDLLEALLRNYSKLVPDLKAEIPLQQVWTLLLEPEEDS